MKVDDVIKKITPVVMCEKCTSGHHCDSGFQFTGTKTGVGARWPAL